MLIMPTETFCHVLSNLVEKNRYGCDRVENIGFWTTIVKLNKEIRRWVLWSEWGPYKLSKQRVIELLPESPQMLRCFLGALNREKVALVEAAFKYLEAPDDKPEASGLASVSPLTKNFHGQSLLAVAIERMLGGKKVAGVLKYYAGLLSPSLFFTKVNVKAFDSAHLIRIAELFFDKTLPREALQWMYGLMKDSENGGLFIEWAKNNGVRFDIDMLAHSFDGEQRTFQCLEKILDYQPEILLQTNAKGDSLLHVLMKSNKGTYYRSEYMELLLTRCPDMAKMRDGDGRSLFFYSLKEGDNIYSGIDCEPTSELYWDVREDVLEGVLDYPKRWGWDFPDRNCCNLAITWNSIRLIFSEESDYQRWLTEPYGKDRKSFIHELIIRSHYLAGRLVKENEDIALIQGDDCEAIKVQFIKYPGLKDFFLWDLFNQLFNPETRPSFLAKLDALFESNWINYQQENGNTVLHQQFSRSCAKLKAEAVAVIAYMMDRGFDPDVKNKAGKSVLDLMEENKWNDYIHLFQ